MIISIDTEKKGYISMEMIRKDLYLEFGNSWISAKKLSTFIANNYGQVGDRHESRISKNTFAREILLKKEILERQSIVLSSTPTSNRYKYRVVQL